MRERDERDNVILERGRVGESCRVGPFLEAQNEKCHLLENNGNRLSANAI